MINPKVTVIIPVYNSELYLQEAIDSVLNQTLTSFECIIIDDASTDKSISIIEAYNDERIRLVKKKVNSGYTESLNIGLTLAKGEYIARMDSDDVCLPERLAKQVEYMDKYPEIGLCGTWIETFGSLYETRYYPKDHEQIQIELLCRSAFAHPSVMFRRSVLNRQNIKYKVENEPAEDYELWVRLMDYCKLANLPEVLLRYRVHTKQVTSTFAAKQSFIDRQIKRQQMERLVKVQHDTDKEFLIDILADTFQKNSRLVCKAHEGLLVLKHANERTKIYNQLFFLGFLKQHWASFLENLSDYNFNLLKLAITSPFTPFYQFTTVNQLRFVVKCVLKWKTRVK